MAFANTGAGDSFILHFMEGVQIIHSVGWSSAFVGAAVTFTPFENRPDVSTLSFVGSDRDAIVDLVARVLDDTPRFLCSHRDRIENRLQETLLRRSLPAGAGIVRQWDGAWVAEPWTTPVWDDNADLMSSFFVADHAVTIASLLARISDGKWDERASRDLALRSRFLIGTRAYPSGRFAASMIGLDADQLAGTFGARVIRPRVHKDPGLAAELLGMPAVEATSYMGGHFVPLIDEDRAWVTEIVLRRDPESSLPEALEGWFLTRAERDALTDILTLELAETGFGKDYRPTVSGASLEDLIDVVNRGPDFG